MVRLLVICPSESDCELFKSLEESGLWAVSTATSLAEGVKRMESEGFPIVVLDRDMPGCEWRDALTSLVRRWPQTCFLLASRVSDEYLWKEVVKHGGYDVLAKPLDTLAVRLVLVRALHYATMPLRTA